MQVTNSELEWSDSDVANWALFLNTPTGRRIIPKIAEQAPRLLAKGEDSELFINHGTVLGFSAAVQGLLDLAVAKQAETPLVDLWPALPPEN